MRSDTGGAMHITPRSESRYRCYLNRSHAIAELGDRWLLHPRNRIR